MYILDLLQTIYDNLSISGAAGYCLVFLALAGGCCALALVIVRGHFRIKGPWKAVRSFSSLSMVVGALSLLTLLPWPDSSGGGGIEEHILQLRFARFEQALCRSLDSEAQKYFPLMSYENKQGIVRAEMDEQVYFRLVCKHARGILPNINLEAPDKILPAEGLEYQEVLLHRIIDWNRTAVKQAVQDDLIQEKVVCRYITCVCALVFLLLLVWRANRYGRYQAETAMLRKNDLWD